jgi:hypothetical protein
VIQLLIPTDMRQVAAQIAFMRSRKRFNIVPAGRRSGKTMTGKFRGFKRALEIPYEDGRVVFAAPTHRQAERIFWPDVKRMFKEFIVDKPLEGKMQLKLINGVLVECAGLDVPERIEGAPLDHIQFDEYADMHPHVWREHVRPMLAQRNGTADFTGTPEGRNHFYELWTEAQGDPEWGAFTWTSEDVLPLAEIERLRRDLDELTYNQEIRASFVNFMGRAYYAFDSQVHTFQDDVYNPDAPLLVCLDFNVQPGVAALLQEHDKLGTAIIDEVYIARDSNTPRVCEEILRRYHGKHKGEVHLYGDATGGLRGSAKVLGSDWDLVRQTLKPKFGDKLRFKVPESNPQVRARVNSLNTRLGSKRMHVHRKCKYAMRDLDGVQRDEAGDIVKTAGDVLTHMSDAFGYYVYQKFPVQGIITTQGAY